jgi:hypothetical protein
MKGQHIASLLAAIVVATAAAQEGQQTGQRDEIGSIRINGRLFDGRAFENERLDTASGRIIGIQVGAGTTQWNQMVTLLVATPFGTEEVDLGPFWYIQNQPVRLLMGQDVTVSGVRHTREGRPVLEAWRVERPGGALVLRDPFGLPLWDALRPVPRTGPFTGLEQIQGQVTGFSPMPFMSQTGRMNILLDAGSGGVRTIDLGPNWFMGRQRMPFGVGDRVTVYLGPGGPPGVIVANGIVIGPQALMLRQNGFPAWQGWRPN